MNSFLRAIFASAKTGTILYWRFLSPTGLGLSFLPALLNLGVAWVLYNTVYRQHTTASFMSAANSADYFSFVVVGSAFFVYVAATMFSLGRTMFWDRAAGTLEAIMLTPINPFAYMTGSMVAAFSTASMNLLILFGLGFILGFHPTNFNGTIFLVAVCLMMVSLFGLGLIVNAVTLIFRDRVNTANTLTTLILVFSGIVTPLQLLPGWAQAIGLTIPFAYALRLLRSSLLSTEPFVNYGDVFLLAITSLLYLALGWFLLRLTIRVIRTRALASTF